MPCYPLPRGRPSLMGILNVTPDSFSDGGRYDSLDRAVAHGMRLMEDGADLIDVGGESTRPGADPVPLEEELGRVLPVVQALCERGVPVSVDTTKPEVAEAACERGACLVNDVSALGSPEMASVCARHRVTVCLMHRQGEPKTMQVGPSYEDVVAEVRNYLLDRAQRAEQMGIARDRIWIDPGFGFGKTTSHNLLLLARLEELVNLGYPLLAGVSRKSFLGQVLGSEHSPVEVPQRGAATLSAELLCVQKGARIIRTHDVRALRDALAIRSAVDGCF